MKGLNKLDVVFKSGKKNLLNVYCTAGFPRLDSLEEVMLSLQENGVDMIEVGMPYSDPIADGPVIQQSNMTALANGMKMEVLFTQLESLKDQVHVPVILMGYFNPVMQFGIERFCAAASKAGVSGVIIPDLPLPEYKKLYKKWFDKFELSFIFLVTPNTDKKRLRIADKMSSGFLYAVSSSSITGQGNDTFNEKYFSDLRDSGLANPVMIGFGINDKATFDRACRFGSGAIIGSAYIKAIGNADNISTATRSFVNSIVGQPTQ